MTNEIESPSNPPTSLLRGADGASAGVALGRVGDQFGRALFSILHIFGCPNSRIPEANTDITSFAEWRQNREVPGAICHFRMAPLKGMAVIHFPGALVGQLVDSFYGGSGDTPVVREGLSSGELNFVCRLAEKCGGIFTAAWREFINLDPQLTNVSVDWSDVDWVRKDDRVIVQSFAVGEGAISGGNISIIYPADAVRTLSKRGEVEQSSDAEPVDADWRERLTTSVLQTRLPLRTVFARPELPLARLMTLKPGDIVPITLPSRVPVSVAGRRFAEATVGEANGRVAIKIEKIEGTPNE